MEQSRQSIQKQNQDKIKNVNATYKLDAKIDSKNDPFKSSNEIKRTFYVSDTESRNLLGLVVEGQPKMDTQEKLLLEYRNMNHKLLDLDLNKEKTMASK